MANIVIYIKCYYPLENYNLCTSSSTCCLIWEFLRMDTEFNTFFKRTIDKVTSSTEATGQTVKELGVGAFCSRDHNKLSVSLAFYTKEGCKMEARPFEIFFDDYKRVTNAVQKGFAIKEAIENEYNTIYEKSNNLCFGIMILWIIAAFVGFAISLSLQDLNYLLITACSMLLLRVTSDSLGFWLKLFSPKETEMKIIDDIDKLQTE